MWKENKNTGELIKGVKLTVKVFTAAKPRLIL